MLWQCKKCAINKFGCQVKCGSKGCVGVAPPFAVIVTVHHRHSTLHFCSQFSWLPLRWVSLSLWLCDVVCYCHCDCVTCVIVIAIVWRVLLSLWLCDVVCYCHCNCVMLRVIVIVIVWCFSAWQQDRASRHKRRQCAGEHIQWCH